MRSLGRRVGLVGSGDGRTGRPDQADQGAASKNALGKMPR